MRSIKHEQRRWSGIIAALSIVFLVCLPSIGHSQNAEVEKAIRALTLGNIYARTAAKEKLIKIGKPAVRRLITLLTDKDLSHRVAAVQILGELGDIEAVEPLIAALKDDASGIRRGAAEALGKIGDAKAIEPIEELSKNDPHPYVRSVAKKVLAKIRRGEKYVPIRKERKVIQIY